VTFSLVDLLLLLIVAAVCGGIGRALAGGTRGGCLTSVVLGFIGALIGTWIAHKMRLPELLMIAVGGTRFPVVWSVIGAALFVAAVHLISGRR
jgi:uncharacterized membrane protein YeaQ/YmgE (transglycosylase-associated protein family)